jgi:hypothetical protein
MKENERALEGGTSYLRKDQALILYENNGCFYEKRRKKGELLYIT